VTVIWRPEDRWEEARVGKSAGVLRKGTEGEGQLDTRESVRVGWKGESQLETCGRRLARVSQLETRGPLEDSRKG
jgi:hypothetical protein